MPQTLKKSYMPWAGNNNDEIIISARNVSKKFCNNLRLSMAYGIMDLSKNLIGLRPNTENLRKNETWAVNNMSFELKRGEILGLIGVNGSGKTTMLRLLSGIFPPDKGEIVISGKVGMLIAVGAGFHPYMTGRENIYLNGTILGMSRKEIDSKFHDIVSFAEIGDYLDAPVSIYSSGMRVRLGFAIAINIEPDILLIDEILAVGDIAFRAKCFNAIGRISKKSAIIFVSHQMQQVMRLCTKLIVMNKGESVYQGANLAEGIEYYYSQLRLDTVKSDISGSGRAKIHNVEVYSNQKSKESLSSPVKINYLDDLHIDIFFSVAQEITQVVMSVAFFDLEMRGGAECFSDNCGFNITNTGRIMGLRVTFNNIPLNPGRYSIAILITDGEKREILLRNQSVKDIQVTGTFVGFSSVQLQANWLYI